MDVRSHKEDKIRNEYVRGSVKVPPVPKQIAEKRLTWYGHVKRRDEGQILRRMLCSMHTYRLAVGDIANWRLKIGVSR